MLKEGSEWEGAGGLGAGCQQDIGKLGVEHKGQSQWLGKGMLKTNRQAPSPLPACTLHPLHRDSWKAEDGHVFKSTQRTSAHLLPADSIPQNKWHFLGSKYLGWLAEPQEEA